MGTRDDTPRPERLVISKIVNKLSQLEPCVKLRVGYERIPPKRTPEDKVITSDDQEGDD